ncbi:MAG TPA: hypothetical protein VJW20_10970 [Candidatus Angelobacter sp.]|nr:hypothetical protein [Candidatus Angelobacter sp.]
MARRFHKPQLFHDGDEVTCFDKLPAFERSAWERAADYYAEVIALTGTNSQQRYLLRAQLAGWDDAFKNEEDRQFVEIARALRVAAAPAYRACRWSVQDERNRKWVEAVKPQLAADEKKLASRLEEVYHAKWTSLPIPVDIVQTVDFTGANTILGEPGTGHILIANENEPADGLEVIFHEASHILMGRDAPVRQALEKAAVAANFKLPGELWHVVLFYTTGEAVRRLLEEEGKSGYKPMLYGIFDRSVWGEYRNALESTWKSYVDGTRTLDEVSSALIAALQKQPAPQH